MSFIPQDYRISIYYGTPTNMYFKLVQQSDKTKFEIRLIQDPERRLSMRRNMMGFTNQDTGDISKWSFDEVK